mmetsp:Transcript_4059/g.11158  ORF Transcript_4059/g.11158 Transcript_4059/m.11158 type:complete len:228 (-) Transcript_4059:1317-2000(-)
MKAGEGCTAASVRRCGSCRTARCNSQHTKSFGTRCFFCAVPARKMALSSARPARSACRKVSLPLPRAKWSRQSRRTLCRSREQECSNAVSMRRTKSTARCLARCAPCTHRKECVHFTKASAQTCFASRRPLPSHLLCTSTWLPRSAARLARAPCMATHRARARRCAPLHSLQLRVQQHCFDAGALFERLVCGRKLQKRVDSARRKQTRAGLRTGRDRDEAVHRGVPA